MASYRIYGLELDLDDRALPEPVKRGLVKGWYERDEVEIIRTCLKPGDRVLELGAGLGVTTMIAAGIVGAGAIKAFEANPAMIPVFEKNAADNGFVIAIENRVLYPRASADRHASVLVDISGHFWGASILDAGSPETSVEAPTGVIEEELAAHQANVLLMDIEGLEVEILEKADLSSVEKLIFEIHYARAGRARTDNSVLGLISQGFRIDFERSRRGVVFMDR